MKIIFSLSLMVLFLSSCCTEANYKHLLNSRLDMDENELIEHIGNVIRTMFREIDAECYIMTDGDDTYPAENAREMCTAVLERKADMVIGDRLSSTYFQENKRPFHNMGNVVVRKLINMIYKSDIRDVMTGYRAFSYQFVKTFPVLSKGFEIETEMTIHTLDKNMGIENIIIEYRAQRINSMIQ